MYGMRISVFIAHCLVVVLGGTSSMAQDPELEFIRKYEFDEEKLRSPYRHLSLSLDTKSPRTSSANFRKEATLDDIKLVVAKVPSLTEIDFKEDCDVNLIDAAVLIQATKLRTLKVYPSCDEMTLRSIGKLTDLDMLGIQDLEVRDFCGIQGLDKLQSLVFGMKNDQRVALDGVPWQSLQALAIDGTEKSVVDIRCDVGEGALESLTLKTSLVGDFSVFAKCPLKKIWHRGGDLTAQQIESLATIRSMEAFDGTKSSPELTDSQIRHLLESWPSLHRFCFRGGRLRPETLQFILAKKTITAIDLIDPVLPEHFPALREAKHLKDLTIFNASRWSSDQRKQLDNDLPGTDVSYLDQY